MTKLKKLVLGLTILSTVVLVSSYLIDRVNPLDEPFHLVAEDFGFRPLTIPDGWEAVAIEEYFPLKQPTNLLNPQYEESPDRVTIHFGVPAPENVFDLEQYNEGRQNRVAKYAVTPKERFGMLSVRKFNEPLTDWSNGLTDLPFPSIDDYQLTEVNGREVYYFTYPDDVKPLLYIWLSQDKKYRYHFVHDSDDPDLRKKTLEESLPILETLISKR